MKKRFVFVFLSLVLFPVLISAHGNAQHTYDMQRIFPFDWENKQIINFYKLVNDYLDKPNSQNTGKPKFLATHPKFNKLKFGNHRIWYHWGFNTNPRNFSALINILNNNITDGIIKQEDIGEFWSLLQKEISVRNKFLMNEATKIFGYSTLNNISSIQREQVNAFVTILYSIHLLGDHQTSEISVISNKRAIIGDIFNAIDNLAGKKKRENLEMAKKIKNRLKIVQDNPTAFLNTMEQNFSSFLLSLKGPLYDYKAKFMDLGYKLK